MTANLKLIILAGAGFDPPGPWTWSIDGTPVNLTGYSARMQVRDSLTAADSTARLSLSSEDGGIVLGGVDGTITLVLSAADATELWGDWFDSMPQAGTHAGRAAYRLGWWDLELESAGGQVTRLLQGECLIVPEATR